MAKVYPFRSLMYAPGKVPIENVVTQPYDKISNEMQDRYYALHPNNIVRIVLGKPAPEDSATDNVYTRAAGFLKDWRARGILEQLAEPAFFVYFQRFVIPGTSDTHIRKGFVGLGQIEDYATKVVFPHERTLTAPKKDRLELLRHTRAHFEQIFMLYEDPEEKIDHLLEEIAQQKPDIQVDDEYGVRHTTWTVRDPTTAAFMQHEMEDKRLIIADGHHRYETGLAYRDEMRGQKGSDRLPMAFFNMSSPALTILPTHRVLSNKPEFDRSILLERASEFFDVVTSPDDAAVTIGVFAEGRLSYLLLKPSLNLAALMPDLSQKQRTLDVIVLHRLIFAKCLGITEDAVKRESYITYVRDPDAAMNTVREGKAQAAFLLNPTRLDQMRDIAYEGNVMPQKSTDFYPKVLSGLLMYALD